jgi:serine-type D-Ala-D-Ala carboxypeptidase/endopeptidase (penicillin-binding protein 4)
MLIIAVVRPWPLLPLIIKLMKNTPAQRWRWQTLAVLLLGPCAQALQAQVLPADFSVALARAGVPREAVSVMVAPLPATVLTPEQALPAPRLSHRAEVAVNPASVMKLITTYAGLDILGPDYTWKNRVYYEGFVVNGVLDGNLVIRGSGDPKLVLERIEDLFKQVQAKGVREIKGDIILDRNVFNVPDKNPADFDDEPLRPYNAAPDGLLVNFKSLIFTFTPDEISKKVLLKTEPPIAGVAIPVEILPSSGRCGDWRAALKADFSNALRLDFGGRFALSCGERVWPVAYVAPRGYAARVLEAMWRASGGTLAGTVREAKTPPTARLLLAAPSLPLSDIAADINKFSNNVMAQQLFLTLSSFKRGRGSFEASRSVVAQWWREKFGSDKTAIAPLLENGSGLSRRERISAAALTALLRHAALSPQAQSFVNSLGTAGVDGTVATMRNRNGASEALGNAQLKTGTLKDVAAIAGYATGRSGQRYSLVAIINHPNAGAARPALDALVEWVVKDQ